MARLNLILLAALVLCALALVTSQHTARKLFIELEREQAREKAIDTEWKQLQLEQSTWAMHSRVAKIAAERLGMRSVDASRIQVVPQAKPEPGSVGVRP